ELECEDGAIGRTFEPWHAVLMVARLGERHGVQDLEARMREVMTAYQQEQGDLVEEDRPQLVVRALYRLACADTTDTTDSTDTSSLGVRASASEIATAATEVAADLDEDAGWVSASRVGRVCKGLRLTQERVGSKGSRKW